MASSLLPTLPKLGVTVASDVDAHKVATEWFNTFTSAATSGDIDTVLSIFIPNALWRDLLALTWDFRTFSGESKIKEFLQNRLKPNVIHDFSEPRDAAFQQPAPDLAWVQFTFTFSVTSVGSASGVVRLVPQKDGIWRCHCILTNLEDLEGYPENKGPLLSSEINHSAWEAERAREVAFEDEDPTVLIVGAGQSGLGVAARLKCLGVSTLIVEKNERVGDNWRKRYDGLCLHDPAYTDHLPYMPFPSVWPVFPPARKFANWLESYADVMDLNVWTSSVVTSAVSEDSGKWAVTVRRGDGQERVLRVNHVVSATGLAETSIGTIKAPYVEGMEIFKGKVLHSFEHKRALDYAGKKVVVVGAATSAHDICADCYRHGVDVTMYQRGSTYVFSTKNGFKYISDDLYLNSGLPTHSADLLNASFPNLLAMELSVRMADALAEADKPLLDALRARGFKLNKGYKGAGPVLQFLAKKGGYYIDVGTSQLIADGKIKLKSDSHMKKFTENGILFEDGTELPADVVVFATGVGETKGGLKSIVGAEVADKCSTIWGLNSEGELYGVWRDLGVRGLWSVTGHLSLCRFYSKHLAMQIKAMEAGLLKERYSLPLDNDEGI